MRLRSSSLAALGLLAALASGPFVLARQRPDEATLDAAQVHDVVARNPLALVAQTGALTIQDLTDPANPHLVGKLSRPGEVWAVALEGDIAYVANGTRGVVAVDLSRPEAPRLLGLHDTPGSARGVAVRGGVVAVADDARGLEIVSFADPARPRSLASLPSRDAVRGVAWKGALLASAEGNAGVRLFDLSSPSAPRRLAQIERPFPALDAALCDGDLLLVAAGESGLQVWNVHDPAKPIAAGSLALEGRVRAVSCERGIAAAGSGDHGITLVDLSSPGAPRVLGALKRLDGYPALRLSLSGTVVLIAAGTGGLGVVSIEDPTAPVALLPRPRKMRIRFP